MARRRSAQSLRVVCQRPRTCRYCRERVAPSTGHRPVRVVGGDAWRPLWECAVTGVALVVAGRDCPLCGGALRSEMVAQLPLLRHGGHGAVEGASRRWCDRCGWRGPRVTASLNPRESA